MSESCYIMEDWLVWFIYFAASSKPAVETKQTHLVLGLIMFGDKLERPLPIPWSVTEVSQSATNVAESLKGNELVLYTGSSSEDQSRRSTCRARLSLRECELPMVSLISQTL